MKQRLEPLAAVIAAMAGAMVAILLMRGPMWLLIPGALGALLPLAGTRLAGTRRRHVDEAQPVTGPAQLDLDDGRGA